MKFNKIITTTLIILSLAGCSTVPVPTAKQAAVLDTVTTAVVLDRGLGIEANPVGFAAVTLFKVFILNYVVDWLEDPYERESIKRATATIWTAAAVNNLAVLAGVATPASLPFTLAAGYVVYINTPVPEPTYISKPVVGAMR
jgi:hypothetical protein